MPVTVIKEGDKGKQGNATCPQCGKIVLISPYFGDPPKCGECGIPYIPRHIQPKYR